MRNDDIKEIHENQHNDEPKRKRRRASRQTHLKFVIEDPRERARAYARLSRKNRRQEQKNLPAASDKLASINSLHKRQAEVLQQLVGILKFASVYGEILHAEQIKFYRDAISDLDVEISIAKKEYQELAEAAGVTQKQEFSAPYPTDATQQSEPTQESMSGFVNNSGYSLDDLDGFSGGIVPMLQPAVLPQLNDVKLDAAGPAIADDSPMQGVETGQMEVEGRKLLSDSCSGSAMCLFASNRARAEIEAIKKSLLDIVNEDDNPYSLDDVEPMSFY